MAETLCGSPLYMAPEILRYEKYDAKADLWSTGAVLYEMCVGRPPFRAQNHVELLKKIERSQDRIKFPDEQPPADDIKLQYARDHPVASDLKDLIRRLLKRNPVERMSFNDFFPQVAQVTATAPTDIKSDAIVPARPAPSPPSITKTASPSAQDRPAAVPLQRQHSNASSSQAPPSRASTPASFPPRYIVGPSSNPVRRSPESVAHPELSPAREPNSAAPPPQPQRAISAPSKPASVSKVPQPSKVTQEQQLDLSQTGDSMLAREYVVVEKGPVEINALADGKLLTLLLSPWASQVFRI